MSKPKSLPIMICAQLIVASGWSSDAYGQPNSRAAFEVPHTGHIIQFEEYRDDGVEGPDPKLTDALIRWIVDVTKMPAPGAAPNFRFAQNATMMDAVMGSSPDFETSRQPQALQVEALYDQRSRTIVLREGWHPSPSGLSVLVHELVHHLQADANLTYACPAAAEALPFEVQEKWLQLFGLSLEDSFEIDKLTLFVLTKCGM